MKTRPSTIFILQCIVLLVSGFLKHSNAAQALEAFDTTNIKKQLEEIYARDQSVRYNGESSTLMAKADSINLSQVLSIIEHYGWLGKSVVGTRANICLWVVIQHADLSTQEKYLPLLKKSVEQGESRAVDLAYLQDRVLMRQGKKQVFGTQIVFNKNGEQEFYPIADEAQLNARRIAIGLEPIEEYAKNFGIRYSPRGE